MDALQGYWAALFPDLDSATLHYSRMSLQRRILERKLLEDYHENVPYVVSPELVWLARIQENPADRGRVTSVLHEMMLDQDHVRRKLQAAALVKNRILVERLFALPDEEKTGKKIIHGIDRVQRKYFDTLTSPSRFVISARAGALSTKAAKEETSSPFMGAPPPDSDLAGRRLDHWSAS